MSINEIVSAFDSLRLEVMETRQGILIRQKKVLRNMLGKSKSGRHVNASISYELQRRGIVHFPKDIPMSQSAIVLLTMRGSPGEWQLEAFLNATREDASEASRQDGAMVARSRRVIENGLDVKDQLQGEKKICSDCGEEYSIDETLTTYLGYWDHPCNYSQGFPRYCLACWLGVGRKDVAKMEAEFAEQMMSMISAPPTGQWLKTQMAELGLTSRMLAATLGVTDRTVKHWEQNGLPINGTATRMVKITLEECFKARQARHH
jgi:DNA-binding transcriptional regulator YiaG